MCHLSTDLQVVNAGCGLAFIPPLQLNKVKIVFSHIGPGNSASVSAVRGPESPMSHWPPPPPWPILCDRDCLCEPSRPRQ